MVVPLKISSSIFPTLPSISADVVGQFLKVSFVTTVFSPSGTGVAVGFGVTVGFAVGLGAAVGFAVGFGLGVGVGFGS